MNFPIEVKSKLINSAIINDQYPYCISFTYFQGQQTIAYGSKNNVVIISNYLTILDSLCEHESDSYVTAVAWTPYSGRLSSCGTDLFLNIWEPVKNGWIHVKKIKIQYIANCISWNYIGNKFCVATKKDFSIIKYPFLDEKSNKIQPIFSEQTTTNFCAFSRDSRFILTLQKNNQIYIWYRSHNSKTEYRRLILSHPATVTSISWRLSEDIFERCSFMSITEDGVARIWIETCVMERLSFHVAISIPAQSISAGCFVMTTSKMINEKSSSLSTDQFANGNGHYPRRDKNSRYSSVPDPRETERNKSWVLCFHRDMKISLWELSGLSLSVRSTPHLKRVMLVDQTNTQFSKLERSFLPKLSYTIATFSKQYRLSNTNDLPIKHNEYIISLILEDQRSHTLFAADIVKRKTFKFSIIGMLKGHSSEIKMFRFHDSRPFMISIDQDGTASFWKVDDTDVYDPSILIQLKFTIGDNVQIADFVQNSNQIIGYNGRSIFLVDYNSDEGIQEEIYHVHSNFCSKGKIIDLKVLDSEYSMSDQIFFISLFPYVFYICSYENRKVHIMFHRNADEGDSFVKGALAYLTMITQSSIKYSYRIATKKKIITIKLTLNEEGEEKPVVYMNMYNIDLEEDEEIVNMKNSRPATVCIVTNKNNIYMGRHLMSKTSQIEILEKIHLDGEANPNVISCLPNGFVAVACEKEIQLFFTGRKSHEFTQSLLSLNCISRYKVKNSVSALEWMENGILVYSEQGQIFALTKFMNTYFLDSNIKLPTIHHSLVSLTFSVPDIHSTVISPLAISGKLNLISKMLNYYDKHFNEDDCKVVLKKYILNMPKETDKEGKHLCSKKFASTIESLVNKIKEENQKIDKKADHEKKLLLNSDSKTENNRLLFIINKMKSISEISFDILDKRSLVYYRAYILSEKSHIPFDIVCCALLSHEKEKLYNMLNIQSWETVERCGIVYWSDLLQLKETLVSIAIRDFNTTQHLSIFFLVLFKRFRALNHLYSTAGDEARASFFIRDFKTNKNKKSALNNAYSALSKHSYHISAAMFILAGKYDTALNVCNTNIHDHSLSYLLACFSDDKKLRVSFIENCLIKEAKEKNDLVAISLFEHLAYDKEIDLTLRMRQIQPGFLYNDMRIFGDVRFCVCEVIKPTIETVRELSRSLLLAGHFFLAAQYITYLNENIIEDGNEINIQKKESNFGDSLFSREFDSDIIFTKPKTRKISNLQRKFPSSVSFQVLNNIPEIENEDEDYAPFIQSKAERENKQSNQNESDYEYDSDNSEDENDNDNDLKKPKRKRRHSKAKKPTKSEFGIDSILGYSHYLDDIDFDYEEDSFSTSEVNEEVEELIDASDSDIENEFINSLKDNCQRSLVRSRTLNNLMIRNKLQIGKRKDINEESTEISFSNKSDSDSNTRYVLFNIARLRLETFFEQSLNLKEIEEIIPTLGKEIETFDGRVDSIHPPLRDFLIQSCKRCSFVYRRILLLSDLNSQRDYIVSLCHSLANLPNLITSTFITSQQITQISHTLWCITTYYNKKLSGQPLQEMRFILAAITTGFFIVGCYNMNIDLLLTLLEQNIGRKKYMFPQVLIDQIKVEIAVPENISLTDKVFEANYDAVNFISRQKENVFSYETKKHHINENDLFHFMWPLFDMMLIDEFSDLIDQIQVDTIKYQQFFTSIRKMKNLCMQVFIYATLNYPIILHIDSLDGVKIQNESIEKMYRFLLSKNDRENRIITFCKEIYSQNSDLNPFKITNVQEKTKLKNRQKIAHFKGGITSFCMSKDTIWVATSQGMKNCSTQDIENEGNEANENEELNDQLDENLIDDSSLVMSDEFLYSTSYYSSEIISLRASDTCPSFLHRPDKYRQSKKPYLILSHPTEDYMLVSDYEGNIIARKFDESNENNISVFHTRLKTKCTALGFQTAGTMFAAAQSNYISLFSFCHDSYNKPYVTYDTYGSSVQSLAFVQGTGIFATCQKPSVDFDATVVFWDSILPPGTSMISSMKLEKVGKPISICFSPKYKSVLVGTNKGSLVLIDTRKYEIVKILKNAHEKNIRALAIDQNESYCVTGGGEGTVKVWDMRSLNNIGEMKNVHSPKAVKTGQKWKYYAITDIHIRKDIIYTSGFDGNIRRIEFT